MFTRCRVFRAATDMVCSLDLDGPHCPKLLVDVYQVANGRYVVLVWDVTSLFENLDYVMYVEAGSVSEVVRVVVRELEELYRCSFVYVKENYECGKYC